jgi:predicted MFS family arabinose efflux permease
LIADRTIFRVLVVLAITQLIGWGTISLTAVVGRQFEADLAMDIAVVFAGTSVLYLTMGLCSPLLARPFIELGGRTVMMAGTAVSAMGFVLLSVAQGPIVYFAAWLLFGVGGSASLSTASYIVLNEIAGRNAKGAIGALMLVTGLSSSIFWPTTSFLSGILGWRYTCLVYAAALLAVSLPLLAFALPRRSKADIGDAVDHASPVELHAPPQGTFYLLVAGIGLNAFVAIGMSAVLIELLKAEGLPAADAVSLGSMLGIVQISARAVDFLGGGRWDGITTGLVAGAALPIAMLLLMLSGGSLWTVAAFIVLYGLGSGALAVARATMPLVFYDKAEFAKASSRIALPLNILSAVSAPILVWLLSRFGSNGLLALTLLCSCAALGVLLLLRRRRPGAMAVGLT